MDDFSSKKKKEDIEDCDDCEICKVMKKGLGGNYGDLMEAFAKQNRKNQNLRNKNL